MPINLSICKNQCFLAEELVFTPDVCVGSMLSLRKEFVPKPIGMDRRVAAHGFLFSDFMRHHDGDWWKEQKATTHWQDFLRSLPAMLEPEALRTHVSACTGCQIFTLALRGSDSMKPDAPPRILRPMPKSETVNDMKQWVLENRGDKYKVLPDTCSLTFKFECGLCKRPLSFQRRTGPYRGPYRCLIGARGSGGSYRAPVGAPIGAPIGAHQASNG